MQFFKTKSRVEYEDEFYVSLPGIIQKDNSELDTFSFELKNFPPEIAKNPEKVFKVTLYNNTINNPSEKLKFKVWFHPMKPFK